MKGFSCIKKWINRGSSLFFAFLFSACSLSGYTTMSFPVDSNANNVKTINTCYLTKGKPDFYSAETVLECVNANGEEVHYEEHHTDLDMLSGIAGILGTLAGFGLGKM